MDIGWRRGDDAANICRGQMNIGRRYQVAVEANGVGERATERATRAGLSVRGCRVSEPSVRDGGLLRWREGCGV